MKIEIYSDVACPWCYIGERRFQRALAAFPGGDRLEVVYRSYQLDPAAPEEPAPMTEYLRRKFGENVEGVQQQVAGAARGEGIRMDFSNGVIVNTLTAHRLLRLAEHEHGATVQRALAEKLFEAYFERGADVSDHGLLAGLAAEVGMDEARVRGYLGSDEGLEETRADLAGAVERGVRAVPTFVFDGRYAVEGAQPSSTFLKVLEEVAALAAQERAPGSGDPTCADGSCTA
jgi:predicted DsbA family dithiol-disulfide isomerase